MKRGTALFTWAVLIIATYHTVRDILQIAGVKNILVNFWHWNLEWCGAYCDYVFFPIEIYIIIAAIVVLWRKRFGALGWGILVAGLIGLSLVYLE